jgi:hypothetical protein
MCYTFYLTHKYVVEHCRSIEKNFKMVLGIYNYDRQQYFKWVQGRLKPTTKNYLVDINPKFFGYWVDDLIMGNI